MNNFICPVCDKSIEAGMSCLTHDSKVYHTACYDMAYLPLATDTDEEIGAKEAASKLVVRDIDRDILRTLLEAGECDVLKELVRIFTTGTHNWVAIESDGQQWYVTSKTTKNDIMKGIIEASNEYFKVQRLWYKGIRHNAELKTVVTISKAI